MIIRYILYFTVPIWRRRRKILLPALAPKILETFIEVFAEQGEQLRKKISERAGKGSFKSWPYLSAYTLDSVCRKYQCGIQTIRQ